MSANGKPAPVSPWFSSNPAKRSTEYFFIAWTFVWIGMVAIVVATEMYERFTPQGYMLLGVVIALPPIVIPLVFVSKAEASMPWHERYSTKANAYVFILAWTANYMWTHYFYVVLGASYTFDAWRLNDVPFCLYLISHSYFLTYHVLSNMVLRRVWHALGNRGTLANYAIVCAVIGVMSYVVAFMETFTIQHFPYYEHMDKRAMYVYGSVFYALYFLPSFPMFLRMDETPKVRWSLGTAIIDALACCMLITFLLDGWRLAIGPIVDTSAIKRQVPFIY